MKIKELPPCERPVEKLFSHGKAALSNAELIGVLLGSGTSEVSAVSLAENVISLAGGLRGLSELDCEELTGIRGIGPKKAASIVCAMELARRVSVETGKRKQTIRSLSFLIS